MSIQRGNKKEENNQESVETKANNPEETKEGMWDKISQAKAKAAQGLRNRASKVGNFFSKAWSLVSTKKGFYDLTDFLGQTFTSLLLGSIITFASIFIASQIGVYTFLSILGAGVLVCLALNTVTGKAIAKEATA